MAVIRLRGRVAACWGVMFGGTTEERSQLVVMYLDQ